MTAITFQALFVIVATRRRVFVIAITAQGPRLRNFTYMREIWGKTMTIMDASFASANPSTRVQGNCLLGRRFLDVTEEFQARAAECQHLANRWGGEGKRQYEELARQWRELAALVS